MNDSHAIHSAVPGTELDEKCGGGGSSKWTTLAKTSSHLRRPSDVKRGSIGLSRRVRTSFAVGGLLLCSLGAAGCTLSGSSVLSTTTTTVNVTTPAAQHEYIAAQQAWVNGSIAPSFQQSMFFSRAALLLSIALTRGVSNGAQYNSAITQLKQLADLPETNDTPVQQSEARHDIRALDHFFSTKGLYH
jgi:hypothetical protein